jgi:hypothetical protein
VATENPIVSDKPQIGKPELSLLGELRELQYNKEEFSKYFSQVEEGWYEVVNKDLRGLLVKLFSDEISNNILTSLIEKPLTIPQIVERCEAPQTSTYRRINMLIDSGIIREYNFTLTKFGQRVRSWYSIINCVRIEFDKKMSVFVKLNLRKK